MRLDFWRRRAPIGCVAAIALAMAINPGAKADNLQNLTVGGSQAQLQSAGFGDVNGLLAGVVDVGAAGGLANTSNPAVMDSFPGTFNGMDEQVAGSNLPNGNPDLPYTSVDLYQLANGYAPTGGIRETTLSNGNPIPDNAQGVPLLVDDNHATEVEGVIVGQGKTDANDTGVAPQATVYGAGSFGAANTTFGIPAVMQQGLQLNPTVPGNTPNPNTVNLSLGQQQYNDSVGVLCYNSAGGKITGYISVAPGNPIPAGATQALDSNGDAIPIYNTEGPANTPSDFTATNDGSSEQSEFVDWAATRYNALIVVAGNEGSTPTPVPGNGNTGVTLSAIPAVGAAVPANFGPQNGLPNGAGTPSDAYNILNVAATGGYNADGAFTYDFLADYNLPNGTSDGRIGVDLVAPGGDPANTNGPAVAPGDVVAGSFNDHFQSTAGGVVESGASDVYAGLGVTTKTSYFTDGAGDINPSSIAGTSFAAPLVAGASALLTDAAPVGNADAVNHLVLKALLMNGTTKTNFDGTELMTAAPGTAGARTWEAAPSLPTNAVTYVSPFVDGNDDPLPPYKNGELVPGLSGTNYPVQSGLDPVLGTGQLNVTRSLINQAAGEQHTGIVNPIGWDYHTIAAGFYTNPVIFPYDFQVGGSGGPFSATLAWDDTVNLVDGASGNTVWTTSSSFTRDTLGHLTLFLFSTDGLAGDLVQNLDFSTSIADNTQYVYLPDMAPGDYSLDVVFQGATAPGNMPAVGLPYGLAWAIVPEPTCIGLLALPLIFLRRRARI